VTGLGKKIKILVVDDEDIVRIALEEYLKDEGFDVFSSVSGEEALEIIKNKIMDIGIIDMRLPGIDGNSLIIEAKKINPDMKFVVHTGSMGYSIPKSLLEIGITESLVFKKPISDINFFVKTLKTLLK